MTFSVLFWNIWLDNQIHGEKNSKKLLLELRRLIDHYQPDIIGLNEVLQASQATSPFVLDYLKSECGYTFNHFAPASWFRQCYDGRLDTDWLIGAGLCSKIQPITIKSVAISNDTPAERRGQKGCEVKAITATIKVGGKNTHIIVAHPLYLRPYTLKDHYQGTKSLENLVRSHEFSKNTILGGDFNEPSFMPQAFKKRVKHTMHMRTGSAWDTTWRHNASPTTVIRANLDQLYWTKKSDFSLQNFEVIATDISDHRPLFATFAFHKSHGLTSR